MNFKGFNYKNNNLFCEHVSLEDISFEFGTPIYVYSGASIEDAYSQLSSSISDTNTEINFALKANSSLGILSLLSKLGAGADIVSGGELVKALHAKINPQKIVFSGVGKTTEEIKLAIKNGIKQINAESYSEIENIISIANELNTKVPVAIRVNPNISVKTHEKIATGSNDTKFGMPIEETANIYKRLSSEKNIKTMGLAIHIGSQIFDMNEFKLAYLNILSVANSLRQEGFKVPNLDLGGGLGVDYKIAKINFFDYYDNSRWAKATHTFDGNNCVPTTGSKSLSTIGNGPTTIEVRKIPTAIFFLLLPIAIHGAKSAIQTTLSACHAANDEMSLGFHSQK